MGCTFFLLIAALIVGIAGWGAYEFFALNRDLHQYTDAEPMPIPVIEPTDEEQSALYARLASFADAVAAKEKASLDLSVRDLNHLLAVEPRLKDYRGIYHVKAITDTVVVLEVSVGVRKFMDDQKYFNGYWHLLPILEQGWITTKLEKIETREREVDSNSRRYLYSYPIMDVFLKASAVKEAVAAADSLKCREGHVVISYSGEEAK